MNNVFELFGWIGGILLAACGLPEMIRTIRDNKCYIGWPMLLMWGLGEILVLVYVIPKQDWPLILNYLMNLIMILVMIKYKLNES